MAYTLADWRARVAGAVRVKQPEDIDAIARRCFDATEAGRSTGVWHETADFYGYADRCNCYPCAHARGER